MKLFGCRHERAVWRAVSTNVWAPGLREHAARCRVCRDVALVTSSLAALPAGASPLPDPHLLWWRGRWLRSREAERALKPVAVLQRVALAAAVIAAVAGAAYLPLVMGWLPVPHGSVTVFRWTVPLLPLACAVAAVAGVSVLMALRAGMGED